MKHETKNIVIRTADIDLLMIPVIEWMNKIDGVITLFSCQDNDGQPYVLFIIQQWVALVRVLSAFNNYGTCEVDFSDQAGTIRFCFRFSSPAYLQSFTNSLPVLT